MSAIDGCDLRLTNVDMSGGRARYGGQVYVGDASATFEGVAFFGGRATIAGGGLALATLHTEATETTVSTLSCDACAFDQNLTDGSDAPGGGGAAFIGSQSALTLSSGLVGGNIANELGGAFLLDGGDLGGATLGLSQTDIEYNGDSAGDNVNDVVVAALEDAGRYDFDDLIVTVSCDEVDGCVEPDAE